MAWWTKATADGMRIQRLQVLPWAVGLSLAAAMLVPVLFEWLQRSNDQRIVDSGLFRAAMILFATAFLGSWASWQFDFQAGTVRWRRLRMFTSNSKFIRDEIVQIGTVQRPNLRFAARNVLCIRTQHGLLKSSLGWSFGAESQARVDRLTAELRCRFLLPTLPEETAETEFPPPAPRRQLSLRRLMLATLAGAIVAGLARSVAHSTPEWALGGSIGAALIAAACVLWFRWGEPAIERLLLMWLVATLPFAWVFDFAARHGGNGPWGLFFFLPNCIILSALIHRANDMISGGLAAAFSLIEFVLMVWCSLRGWKQTLAVAILLGLFSCYCSFVIYAACRA